MLIFRQNFILFGIFLLVLTEADGNKIPMLRRRGHDFKKVAFHKNYHEPTSQNEHSQKRAIEEDIQSIQNDSYVPKVLSSNAIYLFDNERIHLPSSLGVSLDQDDAYEIAETNHATQYPMIPSEKRKTRSIDLISMGDTNHIIEANYDLSATLRAFRSIFKSFTNNLPSRIYRSSKNCIEYKVIDLAIAYDSTYCAALDGKENAEKEIFSIISIVSSLFEQDGLCIKVEISYLEGFCDDKEDPYTEIVKAGSNSLTMLDGFKEYWDQNRADVNRTVAHLFTANDMDKDHIGRGYFSSICMKQAAYSVEQTTWSSDLRLKATLVAHELGHNVGAQHLDESISKCEKYVMDDIINDGSSGFHESTVASIREVIDSRSCVRTVPAN